MRELNYAVKGKVANLRTFVLDEPGHGGACHEYQVVAPGIDNGEKPTSGHPEDATLCDIRFQNGPINVDGNGINGVQHEDLLAVIIDRLEGFQSGPYKCEENEQALYYVRNALYVLQSRTRQRIERNVEGTHKI